MEVGSSLILNDSSSSGGSAVGIWRKQCGRAHGTTHSIVRNVVRNLDWQCEAEVKIITINVEFD